MNSIDMKSLIEEKFKDDPLWEQIRISELDEYLFSLELIDKLSRNTTYSLSQAAEMLGVRDHNLRNYLNRHYLDEYIQPERMGKLYRLDYRCIFKFHMIFILVNQGKRTPADISSYVGTRVEVGHTSRLSERERPINENFPSRNEDVLNSDALMKRLVKVEKSLFIMNWERMIDQAKNELDESTRTIRDWEKEVALIGHEIENLELKRQIKRQEKKSLEIVKESHKKISEINQSKQNGGIFKSLFSRNKPDNINYDSVINDISSKVDLSVDVDSIDNILNTEINKLRTRMEKLQSKKEELFNNKKQKENNFQKSKEQLVEFKKSLSDQDETGYIDLQIPTQK